ncbi:MAG: ppiD [Proteobacteria bacterium]|nr:ppiD [Pseudomonadota bacterium]
MLDSMRRGANTLPAKILLGLLTLSFIGWGIGSRLGASHTDTLATVGDTAITLGEFQRAYQRQSQALSRQIGQALTPDMARSIGLPQQTLGELMADATVADMAVSTGLGVSDERLAQTIADDPQLRAPGAQSFNRDYFTQLLSQNGLSEAMFIAQRRTEELRRQLSSGLVGGLTVPKTMVGAIYRYQNEARDIRYLTLARAQVEPIGKPADDVLATWYEEHKSEFRAPEFRAIEALALTPDAIADPSTVTDEQVSREYERTKDQYGAPEQRRIQQLFYATAEEATAAAQKLKAGATFDQLIVDAGSKPEDVDLGLLSREKVLDPAVADAAFALALNAPSEPVKSSFGTVLLRVTQIEAAHTKGQAEVAPDIRKAIATKAAERSALEMHDEVEDALAGGATLQEVANRFKLKLVTAEVDPDGNGTDGQPVAGLPDQADLLKAAFAADEGGENEPLSINRGFVWYNVAKVTPGRERALDEVKDKAIVAWTDAEAQVRLAAKADDMVKVLKTGTSIDDLAKTASVEVAAASGVTRQAGDAGLGEAGVNAAFAGPKGHVAAIPGPDGTRIVLSVAEVVNPPMPAGAGEAVDIADKIAAAVGQGLYAQYLGAAQEELGTTVNQTLLNAVVGTSNAN